MSLGHATINAYTSLLIITYWLSILLYIMFIIITYIGNIGNSQ